jgi:hypothetical protein
MLFLSEKTYWIIFYINVIVSISILIHLFFLLIRFCKIKNPKSIFSEDENIENSRWHRIHNEDEHLKGLRLFSALLIPIFLLMGLLLSMESVYLMIIKYLQSNGVALDISAAVISLISMTNGNKFAQKVLRSHKKQNYNAIDKKKHFILIEIVYL